MINLKKKLNVTRQNGIHSTLRLTLFSGRLMGILPLKGLMNARSDGLRFTLRSPYSLLYFTNFFGQPFMFIMSFYWFFHGNISVYSFSKVFYYGAGTISILILANFSQCWPKMVMKVEAIENQLPPLTDVSMYYTGTWLFVIVGVLVETFTATLHFITVAKICDPSNILQMFLNRGMPWIFSYTPYSLWKGVLTQLFSIQTKFFWCYNDLLIMVFSIYLTERFKMFNQLFAAALKQGHYSCDEFRAQHLKLVSLVKLINDQIGINIVICFGHNLFWICTQLFFILNGNQVRRYGSCEIKIEDVHKTFANVAHTVYFTYSVLFFFTRTLLVLLLAARVHSASVVPLVLLHDIPRSRFNVEIEFFLIQYTYLNVTKMIVERFIAQIISNEVALSGLDFFNVTKPMITTLLGTIVTYELVLLQFNG